MVTAPVQKDASPKPSSESSPMQLINADQAKEQLTEDVTSNRQIIDGIKSSWPPFSWWEIWTQASMTKLAEAEAKLLRLVTAFISCRFVPIRHWNSYLYTITVKPTSNSKESKIPFVLIHGFAAGVGVWAANLNALSEKRTVHAFDMLGFGRSSRPEFSKDATLAELEFVQSIEDWRKAMDIDKMILVGHSFGGYLATSYTLEYPDRVRHLVLVDPMGFTERPSVDQPHIPIWMRAVSIFLSSLNPLTPLRIAGPYGTMMIKKLRSDLGARYKSEDNNAIYEYVYQCNAQNPTGEMAFATMTKHYGWAKRPMIHRFNGIDTTVSVTFIYGGKSYMDTGPAYEIQSRRADSYVDVQIVRRAGHHVYADDSEAFNSLLCGISDLVDRDEDITSPLNEQQ